MPMSNRLLIASLAFAGCLALAALLSGPQLRHRHTAQASAEELAKEHDLGLWDEPFVGDWVCHAYTGEQDDVWCKSAGVQGDLEYTWAGGDANICSDCWCCKRVVGTGTVVEEPAPSVEPRDAGAQSTPPPEPETCSAPSMDCRKTGCCQDTFFECRAINAYWSECALSITKDPERPWKCHDYEEGQSSEWCRKAGILAGYEFAFVGTDAGVCEDCWCCKRAYSGVAQAQKALGLPPTTTATTTEGADLAQKAAAAAPCAAAGEDCRASRCCRREGFGCYERNATWAVCLANCTREDWTCNALTPAGSPPQTAELGCTWLGEDCMATKLCCNAGAKCVQSDEQAICTADSEVSWAGTYLGGARAGHAAKLAPTGLGNRSRHSLFCTVEVLPGVSGAGQQMLLDAAKDAGAGIFGCDAHAIFDASAGWLPGAHSALQRSHNTLSFWRQIVEDGRFRAYDWTVRTAPEVVFLPGRLQARAPVNQPLYIWEDGAPEALLSTLEVLSAPAVAAYGRHMEVCQAAAELPEAAPSPMMGLDAAYSTVTVKHRWGEDKTMKVCLDMLDVGYVSIAGGGFWASIANHIDDKRPCGDPQTVAFFPQKVGVLGQGAKPWQECFQQTLVLDMADDLFA